MYICYDARRSDSIITILLQKDVQTLHDAHYQNVMSINHIIRGNLIKEIVYHFRVLPKRYLGLLPLNAHHRGEQCEAVFFRHATARRIGEGPVYRRSRSHIVVPLYSWFESHSSWEIARNLMIYIESFGLKKWAFIFDLTFPSCSKL